MLMQIQSDLMLIVDRDAASLQVLRRIADQLGCDRIEAESPESLHDVLAVRAPTIAVLAIDQIETDGLAVLQLLAHYGARPAILLIGSANATRPAPICQDPSDRHTNRVPGNGHSRELPIA